MTIPDYSKLVRRLRSPMIDGDELARMTKIAADAIEQQARDLAAARQELEEMRERSDTVTISREHAMTIMSALDNLMGDSDLPNDDSPLFHACQALAGVLFADSSPPPGQGMAGK